MTVSKGDNLKTPEEAYLPDSRSPAFGLYDIEDQFNSIKKYELAEYVPEDVATQYEVARNLYLYSYNVYRFYMVAQHQALIALEFALKEYIKFDEAPTSKKKKKNGRGLGASLRYVFDKGLVENADFPAWQNRRRVQAEHKYNIQKIEELKEKGLERISLNYDEINHEEHSLEWDYLEVLSDIIPKIRNDHAHGSSTLHNQVLITFENVSIIINKIFQTNEI